MNKTNFICSLFILKLFLMIPTVLAQDNCLNALPIVAGNYNISSINGSQIPIPLCVNTGTGASNGKWFKYTSTGDYSITITTDLQSNLGKDTRFHVYTGSCSNLVCFNGDDDSGVLGTGYLSTAIFNVQSGITYFIAFDNRWSSLGFDFQLLEQPTIIQPVIFNTYTIPTTSTICCVVDMNGDFLDDIVTVQNSNMTILTQKTTGGFVTNLYQLPNLTTLPGWSITAGDFDKNGYNDLVFGGANRLTLIKSENSGTLFNEIPYSQSIFTQRTNFVDIDNDGHLDLFACHDFAQSNVYRNNGTGNLIYDNSLFPTLAIGGNYQSTWSDLNNDGHLDMYLAKCKGGASVGDLQRINLLYQNNGNNTFSEVGQLVGVNDGSQSWSTAIEDFDNDNDMDILVSNVSDSNKLYRNNGNGTFTDVYATSGIDAQIGSWEIQSADFNNDGFIDFIWQNGKELYLNNGNLTFTGYDLSFNEGGIGDMNNDGFLDLQFENKVYFNQPNGNNWITINLAGIQSNKNGIGARIEIYGSWGKQIREIKSGNGFSHQSSLNAHFGIGNATNISKIIIKWPSGIVDEIVNPLNNQSLTITEGQFSTLSIIKELSSIYLIQNPVIENLLISVPNTFKIQKTEIYDLTGRLIITTKENPNGFEINNLVSGNYLLVLYSKDLTTQKLKFIKL